MNQKTSVLMIVAVTRMQGQCCQIFWFSKRSQKFVILQEISALKKYDMGLSKHMCSLNCACAPLL